MPRSKNLSSPLNNNNNNKVVEHQKNSTKPSFASVVSGGQNNKNVSSSSSSSFLNGGRFTPVFSSIDDILPRQIPRNVNPAKFAHNGNVPWKCLFCDGADAFGQNCSKCRRPRNNAAIRLFIGQLSKEGGAKVINSIVEAFNSPDFIAKTFSSSEKDHHQDDENKKNEVLPLLSLAAPLVFVEEHTDGRTGQSKGCAWLYCSCIADMDKIIDAIHKRVFVTVSQKTGGEVGFVAFPASASHDEIEASFQADRATQSPKIRDLFLFSTVSVQIPNSISRFVTEMRPREKERTVKNNNGTADVATTGVVALPKSKQQQQQQQRQPQQEELKAFSTPMVEVFKKPTDSFKQQQQTLVNNNNQQNNQQQNNSNNMNTPTHHYYSWNQNCEDNVFCSGGMGNTSFSTLPASSASRSPSLQATTPPPTPVNINFNNNHNNNNNNNMLMMSYNNNQEATTAVSNSSTPKSSRRIIVHNPYQYTAWQMQHEQYYDSTNYSSTYNNDNASNYYRYQQQQGQQQQQASCNKKKSTTYQEQRAQYFKHQQFLQMQYQQQSSVGFCPPHLAAYFQQTYFGQ